MEIETIIPKEKRNSAVSVRLPNSSLIQLKQLARKYKRSQSEIIEHAIKIVCKIENEKGKNKNG